MADIKALVRRHFDETWNEGRFDAVDAIYGDGYQSEIPLLGRVDLNGLRGAVGAYRKAFPDLRFEVKQLVQEGDQVAVRWVATGTNRGEFMGIPATGKNGQVNGLSLIEVKGGKIVRDVAQMDELSLFQQLGLQLPMQGMPGVQRRGGEQIPARH